MAFRFPVTVTLALILVALGGRSAVASSVLGCGDGDGDSLECRFVAACKQNANMQNISCTCVFALAKQTFPPEQLSTVVAAFEATADKDEARQQFIIASLAREFNNTY
jgi:hypothetical protein